MTTGIALKMSRRHSIGRAFANRAVGPNGSSNRYYGPQSGLLDAVYSAGVFDEETVEIEATARKTSMRVIAKGLDPNEKRDAFDVIARALQAVQSFWNEPAPDNYTISIRRITPPDEEGGGTAGTELSNGFAVALYGNERCHPMRRCPSSPMNIIIAGSVQTNGRSRDLSLVRRRIY